MKTPVLAAAAVLILLGVSANGQANLSFSGGNGSPLTLTLDADVNYVITGFGSTFNSPIFVFQNVGNIFGGDTGVSGTMFYKINNSIVDTFDVIGSGFNFGSVGPNDVFIFSMTSLPGVTFGDVVTLVGGTLTTTSNVAAAAPADGAYPSFVSDLQGNQLSGPGVSLAVPEPATWGLLLLGGMLLCAVRRATRRSQFAS